MISHRHKFIYVHIPKTAGTSIESVLLNYCKIPRDSEIYFDDKLAHWNQHLTFSEIRKHRISEHDFWEYFKFSFVRNPWDRVLSAAMWRKMSIKQFLSKDFNEDRSIKNKTDPERHRMCQFDFLFGEGSEQLVDYIGRLENLQQDFDTVCDKIGIPRQELPHTNKSDHKHYTEYYDNDTRQTVAEKYAKDIEYFGYKFGE